MKIFLNVDQEVTFKDLLQFFFLNKFCVQSKDNSYAQSTSQLLWRFLWVEYFLKKIVHCAWPNVTPTWPFDPSRSCNIFGKVVILLLWPSLTGNICCEGCTWKCFYAEFRVLPERSTFIFSTSSRTEHSCWMWNCWNTLDKKGHVT